MTGKLILFVGISGAGKSTLAKAMREKGLAHCYYEADMFMVDNAGNYKFDPKRLHYCHQQCGMRVNLAMSKGLTVIQSNTNLRRSDLESYFDDAKYYNYNVEIIKLDTFFESKHGVPPEKLAKMKHWFDNIDLSNLPDHVAVVEKPIIS